MVGFIVVGVIVVLCGLGDWWLGRHPLKKADEKAKKYEYRGF